MPSSTELHGASGYVLVACVQAEFNGQFNDLLKKDRPVFFHFIDEFNASIFYFSGGIMNCLDMAS
jgi:hypothetical protein